MAEQIGRPVVVTTTHRGVFFGYAEDTSGETIKLKRARNAFYWMTKTGFMELAETGPKKGSKIGARADIELRNVASVLECTPEAAEAWEGGRWE